MTTQPIHPSRSPGATSDQLRALIRSHAEGDDELFYSVALQVAARLARAGQDKFALELRDMVDEFRPVGHAARRTRTTPPKKRLDKDLETLLTVSRHDVRLVDLVMPSELVKKVRQLLTEHRQRDNLTRHGLHPARRVLLIGQPGTGKTSTARAIAGELGLPLYAIRLDTVITKFLGETAAKLRLVFDAVAEIRSVYLFDEVDALAGERATPNDVGEMRRVLNSFLQFLEEDTSESIIIAATNHPKLLDNALYRRFDLILKFSLPNELEVASLVRNRLARFDISELSWAEVARAGVGLSQAEIVLSAESAAKLTVLNQRLAVQTTDLIDALRERQRLGRPSDKQS